MANRNRKLASVQLITNIRPIPNADRIEQATVLGFNLVTHKGNGFHDGQKIVYIETDSLMPDTNPLYDGFQKNGSKTMTMPDGTTVSGYVVRTMRLRGVYSQGVIMPLSVYGLPESTPVGTDLTEQAGLVEYEPPLPLEVHNALGRNLDVKIINNHYLTKYGE